MDSSGDPSVNDVRQGALGTCYFMAALAAIATKPSLMKTSLLVDEKNTAGVYGVDLYIRGRPHTVSIDEIMVTNINGNNYIP